MWVKGVCLRRSFRALILVRMCSGMICLAFWILPLGMCSLSAESMSFVIWLFAVCTFEGDGSLVISSSMYFVNLGQLAFL